MDTMTNITVDHFGLQNLIGCIHLILYALTNETTLIFQVNQGFRLNYPVFQKNYPEIKGKGSSRYTSYKPNIYIVDIDEVPVARFVDEMRINIFNLRANFIFIGHHFNSADVEILTKSYIFNFIFVTNPTGEIKTAFPYKLKSLNNNFSKELENIGHCKGGKLFSEGNLFPDKIPSYWGHSKIHIMYRHSEPYTIDPRGVRKGIEFDLLDIVMEKMELTAKYKNEKDLRSNALVYYKYSRQSDLRLGNLVASLSRVEDEQTAPYNCYSLFWYVSRPDKLPKWKLIFRAFSIQLFLILGFIILLFCLLWYMVYAMLRNQKPLNFFLNKLWVILTLILEQPASYITDYITTGILINLIFHSFLILNVLYRAKYTALLNMDNYEDSIESIEDIMKNKLLMGLTSSINQVFRKNPVVLEYIMGNYVICDLNTNECLLRAAFQKDMAVMDSQMKAEFFSSLFLDEFGVSHLNRVNPPLLSRCNTFYFPVGHPMYPAVNKYVKYLVNHGFVQKVISKYLPFSNYINSEPPTTKMNFDDVKAAFIILLLGNFIGFFLFLFEKFVRFKMGNFELFKAKSYRI